jgi:sugar phosphate isomerase/epimerase
MCLPSKQGTTDFYDIFSRLKDKGFNGALILEVYKNDFDTYKELFDSLDYVSELADKVFK